MGYVAIFRSIGKPVFKEGFVLLMCRDSRICRSDLFEDAMILKLFCSKGWPVVCECSRIAEYGGDWNGRLLLTEIPLCSPTLTRNWRLVDPKYWALQLKHWNLYIIDEHRVSGRRSLCLKKDCIEKVLVHINWMFSCGNCLLRKLFSSDVILSVA